LARESAVPKKYSSEQIEHGLIALATHGGSPREASRACGIPFSTLKYWRDKKYVNRYEELAQAHADATMAQVARDSREFAKSTREAEILALKRTIEKLERDEDKTPAQTLQRLLISKAIAVDKDLAIRQKPVSHVVHSTQEFEETLRWLRARAIPDAPVNAEVVEEPAAPEEQAETSGH
jgi:hypothetical protein